MPQGTGEGHGRSSSHPLVVRQWGKSSKPDQSREHQNQEDHQLEEQRVRDQKNNKQEENTKRSLITTRHALCMVLTTKNNFTETAG